MADKPTKTSVIPKRVAISKANAQMVLVLSISAFVTVFCLFAAKAVWSQNAYQAKVITAKTKANNQLKQNIQNYESLSKSYQAFNATSTNVISGNANGTGDNDGNNAKIVLDALPSSYDFPALTSSIEKILGDRGIKVSSITGVDDQVNQQANTSSGTPQPVPIPFTFSVSNLNYASAQQLITALEHSIRPIQIQTMDVSGGGNNIAINITAQTFFQPATNLDIKKEVVR